jgi:hypothetical protein
MNHPPPQPKDVIAWVTVRLHDNGMLSTSGTIGDPVMACHLLDQAKEALRRNVKDVVIPARDVECSPAIPVRALGSMAEHERGDG